MLCHLFLGYNRLGIFLRHRPFALRSRSLSLARQLKGLHGGVGLFWKNPPMPLYWLARKWWAKTAPCRTATPNPFAEPVAATRVCQHAPSTGSGSGSFFLLCQSPSAELVEGNIPKKNDSWKKWGS